jgi:acyl-CoA synthetase (NDP forming)
MAEPGFDRSAGICQNWAMRVLDCAFWPKSIAVVGASPNPDSRTTRNFLQPLLWSGCPARVYPVNPHASEIMGLRAYPSVAAIPEPVDYVICGIPAVAVPAVVRDCALARARVLAIFTAGFSETGEKPGIAMEREIVDIARQGGVRVIGPNCLGVHSPAAGVFLEVDIPPNSGQVSFLSQSGGYARQFIVAAAEREVFLNKLVSYGNAADLNEADFLEYFGNDSSTAMVAAYIEGVREPRRFVSALRRTAAAKPVVIMKGGNTEAGRQATASHTASISGSGQVWQALCRQLGVMQAGDLDEMTDTIQAFGLLRPLRGRRIGIVGIGGGVSVMAADDCENAGLVVPPFLAELRRELGNFTSIAGTSLRNPVDTSAEVYWDEAAFARTIDVVARWDGIDILFIILNAVATLRRGVDTLRRQGEAVVEAAWRTDKPVAIVIITGGIEKAEHMAMVVGKECAKAGFPVFPSCSRAARATNQVIRYHERRGTGLPSA